MANERITDKSELLDSNDNDWLYIIDVSDLTENESGTGKKIRKSVFLESVNQAIVDSITDSTIVNGITTSSSVPSTGNIHAIGIGPGTYTNWGGMVIPVNNIGTLQRVNGVYSVSLTPLVIPASKIETWTAKSYLSGDQVNHLGKDWVSNAATLSTDIPGTSSKWVERLTNYVENSEISILSPDKSEWILNEAWVNAGVTAAYTGKVRSPKFKVSGGKTYVYKGYGEAGVINVLELDANDVYIVRNTQAFGTNNGLSHSVNITLHKDTRFVALTCQKTIFDAFGCFFVDEEKPVLKLVNIQNSIAAATTDNTAVKINLIGDSISLYGTLTGGWMKLLLSSFGMTSANLGNYAVGGNRLSIPLGGNDATIAGGNTTAMCVRYAAMSDDADVVIVNGGSNDGNSRVGTLAELTATTPDKTTITGAMRVLIEGIYAKYAGKKNVKLIWILCPRSYSYSNNIDHTGVVELDLSVMINMMKSVLDYYGVAYVDLYNESGINRFNARPNPNVVYGNSWINQSSSLTGTGTFDTVVGYEATDYIPVTAGSSFCSNNWCKVSFYNASYVFITGSTQFNDSHATVNYTAPATAAFMRVSKPNSTTLYLTNAVGTMMCDVVHPTLNAQEILFKMVASKLLTVKKL